MNIAVIIPAFNEASVIQDVLNGIRVSNKNLEKLKLIVVDDGSSDETANLAAKSADLVLKHFINRGLGASLKTGFEWAKLNKTDLLITFDGDGQHNPEDIKKLIEPIIKKKADVVIGSRFKKNQKMPKDRMIINNIANIVTFFLFGVYSTDSQSGLRAFSKKAIFELDLTADRMDISTEILVESKRKHLKLEEIPIEAIYTNYSRKKGQKNTNAFPILVRFAVKLLR